MGRGGDRVAACDKVGGTVEVILDPTNEAQPAELPLAAPLEGPATVALLDIRKPRGDVFLDELERLLAERCDAVIEALAD